MNSIELLKQELQEQKSAIESKGGSVSVSNINVSPAEITAGIKTIPSSDFSSCTATESDVLLGKTFYAGNNTMKTGTLVMQESDPASQNLVDYLLFEKTSETYPDLEINFPSNTLQVKDYFASNCKCKADIYLNPELESIRPYAFYPNTDITIHNLENATNLSYVGTNAFRGTKGIDLSALPSTITTIDNYAFSECAKYSDGITLPSSLVDVGNYAFSCSSMATINSLDISNVTNVTFSLYMFQYIKCLGELIIPEGTKTLSSYFNYNGSIKSVTFPTTFNKVNPNVFNANANVALEDLITESYIFLGTTPPTFSSSSFCNRLLDRTDKTLKFFVPDESIEAYKSISALSNYVNNIYPMSQKT